MDRSATESDYISRQLLDSIAHVYAYRQKLHSVSRLDCELALAIQTTPVEHHVRVQSMSTSHSCDACARLHRLLHNQPLLSSRTTLPDLPDQHSRSFHQLMHRPCARGEDHRLTLVLVVFKLIAASSGRLSWITTLLPRWEQKFRIIDRLFSKIIFYPSAVSFASPNLTSWRSLPLDLLRPCESETMEMHEANPKVNNVRNNGPELVLQADGIRTRCTHREWHTRF